MRRDRGPSGLPPRDRGQSVAINYTLSLIIVTVLISALFMSMSDYLESEREQVTRSELEVLGNRVTADIATVDRLARTTAGDDRAEIRTGIPQEVAGVSYSLRITSTPTGSYYDVEVQLRAPEGDVTRNVSVRTETPVTTSTLAGGSYAVVYDGSTIEVDDD